MRHLRVFLPLCVVLLAFASSASAHHLTVTPPGGGGGTDHWVGGPLPLPAQAQGGGLFTTMFGTKLAAAHGTGLVQACRSTSGSEVVSFVPPPFFLPDTNCMHGEPTP